MPPRRTSSALPIPGFANYTDAAPTVQGVPQMQLSNPFTSAFPVVPSYGKAYGTYTGLGGGLTYFNADRPRAYSNRVNISIQRQLPQNIILDVTYFLNRSSHITTVNYDINQVDPRIAYSMGPPPMYRWPTRSTIFRSPISPRARCGTSPLYPS